MPVPVQDCQKLSTKTTITFKNKTPPFHSHKVCAQILRSVLFSLILTAPWSVRTGETGPVPEPQSPSTTRLTPQRQRTRCCLLPAHSRDTAHLRHSGTRLGQRNARTAQHRTCGMAGPPLPTCPRAPSPSERPLRTAAPPPSPHCRCAGRGAVCATGHSPSLRLSSSLSPSLHPALPTARPGPPTAPPPARGAACRPAPRGRTETGGSPRCSPIAPVWPLSSGVKLRELRGGELGEDGCPPSECWRDVAFPTPSKLARGSQKQQADPCLSLALGTTTFSLLYLRITVEVDVCLFFKCFG